MTTAQELASGTVTFHSSSGPVLDDSLTAVGYRTQIDVFRNGLHAAIVWLDSNAKPNETTIRKSIERALP